MTEQFTNLPLPLQERLSELYPPDRLEALVDVWSKPRHTTLRINTLKTDSATFLSRAKEEGVVLQPVEWNEHAFILESPTLREFTETKIYEEGLCYVQSFSSMIPPLVLAPAKQEKILDLCAAPGSKTSQLSMLMDNTGEILANDASHTRIYRLRANMEKLGATNVRVVKGVGQGLWHDYPEYFDRTLVDVPCSMEGRISVTDPKSYADWSVKKVKELQEVQKFLMRSAISSTKVGGCIVYSTCTLSPEENEGVIDWILSKEAGTVELEAMTLPGVPFTNAVPSWHGKPYAESVQLTKRIFPSVDFEGFYIAKLRKIATSFPSKKDR